MQSLKKVWFRLHRRIRQPIILTIGVLFVLSSGLIGWLPGPGGLPLFLIGVAILATEFKWAERVRDTILKFIHTSGSWIRQHPYLGAIIIATGLSISIYLAYNLFKSL